MTEQRYRAVLEVDAGVPVTEVAERFGVSRQAVHRWIGWYRDEGLDGLADRSHRPHAHPAQTSPEVEAAICELRRAHPRWGQRRLHFELGRLGCPGPVPALTTIYRVLVRHGLIDPVPRRRRREDYRRWQREVPMELWQMDIVGGIRLADGGEAKVVTGVDDHSRFCVIATVVRRATGRAVCLAFAEALTQYGIPDEVLTDNGKQFTGRFNKPRPGEVLFERICRENAIVARNTKPRSPTTTGKVERFHQTLERELLDAVDVWPDIDTVQAAVDAFRLEYNTNRPHQSLDMAFPADRFTPRPADERLPLRLPPTITTAVPTPIPVPAPRPAPPQETLPDPVTVAANGVDPVNLAVEIDRIVPASGNLQVCGQQFWLGPDRAGTTITLWADSTVVHIICNGVRLKTVPSRLATGHLHQLLADGGRPAGPPPLPTGTAQPGTAIEVDRLVNGIGAIGLAGRQHPVGYHFAGRRVTVRLDGGLLQLVDQGVLLRSLPNPLTPAEQARLRDARPAGPPPQPAPEPVRVQRRADSRGAFVVAGQKIHIGARHAGQNPRRSRGRHHLPRLRRRPVARGGPPHHHQAHRPVQGPQARTTPAASSLTTPAAPLVWGHRWPPEAPPIARKQVTMNRLRVRLQANHARVTFPHAIAVLRALEPDLQAPAPDWLTIAETLEANEPGGTRPAGFKWTVEASLRPDDGQAQDHLAIAQAFAAGFPSWLVEIPLAGNPDGLGRHQRGLVLLQASQFLRVLPGLFTDDAPALWARSWPNLQQAAIDVDHLDPCCDGLSGYFVELFRGGHDDTELTTPQTTSQPSENEPWKII